MSEILKKENILTNCKPAPKVEIIKKLGQILYEDGCIEKEYIQGMIDKEGVFNTNIGNSIAIPHGIESSKVYVKKAGIAIMTIPEGTDWGSDEPVRIVIAIAGDGDVHIDILGRIAEVLSDPDDVEKVVNSNADEIYALFA